MPGDTGTELGLLGPVTSRERLAVLHVIAPGDVGGAERVVHTLATGQHRAGHRVAVATVLGNGADRQLFLAPLDQAGVETMTLRISPRAYGRERAAIVELCRRLRPDVVHTHGYHVDVVDAGAARRAGVPTVTTVHGFTGGDFKNWIYERLQRRAFRRFDAVVGDGRQRSHLQGEAARLGVGDRVRWLGTVAEAGRLFAAFDVFALSSRTEGTPIVLFEAMAAEAPIVATAVGGVPDVVTPREALLVAAEDPAGQAQAIRSVFTNPAAAGDRARRARARLASEFAPAPWLERYEAIYRSLG